MSILELILSFFITWAVGMTPPVIIRMIMRRPIGKWPAIVICSVFAFLNIMIFIALGSESKSHAAVFFIGVVSYWILREENFPYKKIKKYGVGWLIVALPLFIVATTSPNTDYFSKNLIDAEVRGMGAVGYVIFISTATAFSVFGLPRTVIGFLSGYAFGAVMGVAVTLVATISGYLAVFLFVRYSSRKLISGFDFAPLKIANHVLKEDALLATIAVQLLPLGSGYITTVFAALTNIRTLKFFFGTAIAFVPQAAIFSMVGAGMNVAPEIRISVSVALLIITGALCLHLYRKYWHEKPSDKED